MKHLPVKLFLAAVALGVLFDILVFGVPRPGLNMVIMELLFLGFNLGLALNVKHHVPTTAWVSASYALAFAATFAIWTSEIGLTLSGLGFFVANVLFALSIFGHHVKFRHPLQIVGAGFLHGVGDLLTRFSILNHLKIPGIKPTSQPVARGVMIAVPIVLIFAALFISSDLILQQSTNDIAERIADLLRSGDVIGHIVMATFFTTGFLLFFATAFWKRIEFPVLPSLNAKHSTESSIILGSTSLLFLGFIIFQGVYLFGGQAAWESIEGITYADYAVSGFFELAVVAFLVLTLILTLRHFHLERVAKLIRIFESILIVETVLIIFSAWIRMNLYTSIYGHTPARLFGFWFFIVTGVTLLMLLVNIIRQTEQSLFVRNALLFTGVAMLIFTASAPDALSVRLNDSINPNETPFDVIQFYRTLSAEAIPAMHDTLKSQDFANYYFGNLDLSHCSRIITFTNDATYFDRLQILTNDEINQVDLRREKLDLYNRWRDILSQQEDWQSWNLSAGTIKHTIEGYVPSGICGSIVTE